MKPFIQAQWEVNPEKEAAIIREALRIYPNWTEAQAKEFIAKTFEDPVYVNDIYSVSPRTINVPEFGGEWIHLSIKRIDKEPIHDWRDLQEIKNMMVGKENEAIELYPAESRRVDSANQYHLYVLKDKNAKIPIGFTERLVMDAKDFVDNTGGKQRPFNKSTILDNIISEQAREINDGRKKI